MSSNKHHIIGTSTNHDNNTKEGDKQEASQSINTCGRFGRTKIGYSEIISNSYNRNSKSNGNINHEASEEVDDTTAVKASPQSDGTAASTDIEKKLTEEEKQYAKWSEKRKELLLHYLAHTHNLALPHNFLKKPPISHGLSAQRMFRKFCYPKKKTLTQIFSREDMDKAAIRTASNIAFMVQAHSKLKEQQFNISSTSSSSCEVLLDDSKKRTVAAEDKTTDMNMMQMEMDHTLLPVVLVLDNLRSAYNVGAILRIAETSACDKVMACGITPFPPHAKLERTACGADKLVPLEYHKQTNSCLQALKEQEYYIFALEEGSTTIKTTSYCHLDLKPIKKNSFKGIALLIGAEMIGLSAEIMSLCDECIEIPMLGLKTSLNVSTATSVAVFELMRLLGRFDRFKV